MQTRRLVRSPRAGPQFDAEVDLMQSRFDCLEASPQAAVAAASAAAAETPADDIKGFSAASKDVRTAVD